MLNCVLLTSAPGWRQSLIWESIRYEFANLAHQLRSIHVSVSLMSIIADVFLRRRPSKPPQRRLRIRYTQILGHMVILRPRGEMTLDVTTGRAGRPRGVLLRRLERGS